MSGNSVRSSLSLSFLPASFFLLCVMGRLWFSAQEAPLGEFRPNAPRINPNRLVLKHVPVPLRVGAAHGQKVELLALQHGPDRNRNCISGLPAEHADLDLAVAGEAGFERVLRYCHGAP